MLCKRHYQTPVGGSVSPLKLLTGSRRDNSKTCSSTTLEVKKGACCVSVNGWKKSKAPFFSLLLTPALETGKWRPSSAKETNHSAGAEWEGLHRGEKGSVSSGEQENIEPMQQLTHIYKASSEADCVSLLWMWCKWSRQRKRREEMFAFCWRFKMEQRSTMNHPGCEVFCFN